MDKPYVVFCGTASVGKTTLIMPLASMLEKKYNEPVAHIAEVARSLEKKGHTINRDATTSTQRLIEDEYSRLEGENANRIMISDRSIIDRFSYALLNGGSSHNAEKQQELINWYAENIKKICEKYSHIFHVPLIDNLKLELDGVRSPDEAYRKEIDAVQKHIIQMYNIKVCPLVGTTEERLAIISQVMETKDGASV